MTAHTIYACQLAGGDWQARCSCGWTGRVFRKSGGALREREAHLDHTATRDTGDDLRELVAPPDEALREIVRIYEQATATGTYEGRPGVRGLGAGEATRMWRTALEALPDGKTA